MLAVTHRYEIALLKRTDDNLDTLSEEGIVRSLMGSARSMGLNVVW